MARKRIRHEKSGAKRGAFHKQPAKCEGCGIVDYEKCRRRSFPESCYWRDHTPLDLAVRLGMVKWPRFDQEPGVNVDSWMVRFLRDGACKR